MSNKAVYTNSHKAVAELHPILQHFHNSLLGSFVALQNPLWTCATSTGTTLRTSSNQITMIQ